MLTFDEALETVLQSTPLLGSETVELLEGCGRVLAETLCAEGPLPAFDYSAMDGYALRAAALVGEPPYDLPVSGESRTGRGTGGLVAGAACRIFTGAPIPDGADAVVLQEEVARIGERIRISQRPSSGDNIRRSGEDLAAGAVALASGTRLNAYHIGLAAAVDRPMLRVAEAPRVVIVPTGDELRAPGSERYPGSVAESNSFAVAGLAREVGAIAHIRRSAVDDLERLCALFEEALRECDLLVTIGGVSVGDYDLVRPALQAVGARLDFWKVAIKPGKPLVLGHRGAARILGLPGNPVSAQVTFTLFGIPLLRAMQGELAPKPRIEHARLAREIRQRPGRRGFYRGRLQDGRAELLDAQSSGAVTSMARANCLIVVPETAACVPAENTVEVIPFYDR